ncbi:hypothetical protein [Pelosinus sp. sgz500959]|uniref:hypothetical protein n=1 Tax=Pelosinus sp. sgz500959 TaxID=3242472 RepID=UPI00366B4146
MGFFDDICNRHWCEELECACGTDVVLFTADGFTFFGLLDRIEDGILFLLPASCERSVIVLTPGGALEDEELSFIDICIIVAISKNVCKNPFHRIQES